MSMLEKAARAAARASDGSEDGWKNYLPEVRAVLEALRELPDEIVNEHLYSREYGSDAYHYGWQPTIDAILNPGTET